MIFRFGGAPEMQARAESIPSAEVPDIMPRTSVGFVGMKRVKEIFTTDGVEDAESAGEAGEGVNGRKARVGDFTDRVRC